jgi:hypothetical protein
MYPVQLGRDKIRHNAVLSADDEVGLGVGCDRRGSGSSGGSWDRFCSQAKTG